MKNTAIAVCVCATAIAANAEVLSPEQALSRAMNNSGIQAMPALQQASPMALELTLRDAAQPTVYVFGGEGGYLVLSADDIAEPLLGYSDSGSFDPECIPDNMAYWLGEYSRQISWARQQGITKKPERIAAEHEPIAPLCSTRWSQGAPFNYECPTIGSTRAITGCVATAQAQIMKAHNWPDKGEGRKSYYLNALGSKINMVFETTEFDWDNMLDRYAPSYTPEQRTAVAMLMKACGYSVEMDYTTGACGAQSFNVAVALPKYFKYDKGIRYVLRDFWGAKEWDEMIYAELAEGRPVYYSGINEEAGHAFVCDGYSHGGYYHINWGWGGQSDGYFLLNGLDPSSQGLGGSDAGYNSWQEVVLNIKPRTEGEESATYKWMGAFDYNFERSSVKLGEAAVITSWFYNYSIEPLTGRFGLKLRPTDGGETIYLTEGSKFTRLGERSSKSGCVLLPEDLAEGTYIVTVGFTDSDEIWHDCRVAMYATQEYEMKVSNGYAQLAPIQKATVKVTDVGISPFCVNSKYKVEAQIENASGYDYYQGVRMVVRSMQGREVTSTETIKLDLAAGETTTFKMVADFSVNEGVNIDYDADYIMVFLDDKGGVLSDYYKVNIKPESKPVVKFSPMYMTDGKNTNVDPSKLSISVDVDCESGYFAENLKASIFYYSRYGASGSALSVFESDLVILTEGRSATIVFEGNFGNAEENKRYMAQIWYDGSWVAGGVDFRTGSFTGISDAEIEDAPTSEEYYSLQGMLLRGKLQSGTCIKVCRYADGTVRTEKMTVR